MSSWRRRAAMWRCVWVLRGGRRPLRRTGPPPGGRRPTRAPARPPGPAGAGAGLVGPPPKPIEDLAALVGRDAGTGVIDDQLDTVPFRGHAHVDRALFRRVFAGVVEQNSNEVIEPFRRGGDHVRIPTEPDD